MILFFIQNSTVIKAGVNIGVTNNDLKCRQGKESCKFSTWSDCTCFPRSNVYLPTVHRTHTPSHWPSPSPLAIHGVIIIKTHFFFFFFNHNNTVKKNPPILLNRAKDLYTYFIYIYSHTRRTETEVFRQASIP